MSKRKHPEDDLQRAVLRLVDLLGVRQKAIVFHPPNGGGRSKIEAAIFKSLGVLPGVADLVFLTGGGSFVMELKIGRGKLSPAQVDFRDECARLGIAHAVARTPEQAREILDDWGLTRTSKEMAKCDG